MHVTEMKVIEVAVTLLIGMSVKYTPYHEWSMSRLTL
jgi:hypothetical protein